MDNNVRRFNRHLLQVFLAAAYAAEEAKDLVPAEVKPGKSLRLDQIESAVFLQALVLRRAAEGGLTGYAVPDEGVDAEAVMIRKFKLVLNGFKAPDGQVMDLLFVMTTHGELLCCPTDGVNLAIGPAGRGDL